MSYRSNLWLYKVQRYGNVTLKSNTSLADKVSQKLPTYAQYFKVSECYNAESRVLSADII